MIDAIYHGITDLFILISYGVKILIALFSSLLAPFNFISAFVYAFFVKITSPITYEAPLGFINEVSIVLNAIPLWSALSLVAGAGFLFLIGFASIKVIAAD